MGSNGFSDLFYQPTEFADFGGQRIGATARTGRRRHLDLHRVEAARNLSHLPRKIGGAARQIADLIAEIAAVAQTVADGINSAIPVRVSSATIADVLASTPKPR